MEPRQAHGWTSGPSSSSPQQSRHVFSSAAIWAAVEGALRVRVRAPVLRAGGAGPLCFFRARKVIAGGRTKKLAAGDNGANSNAPCGLIHSAAIHESTTQRTVVGAFTYTKTSRLYCLHSINTAYTALPLPTHLYMKLVHEAVTAGR